MHYNNKLIMLEGEIADFLKGKIVTDVKHTNGRYDDTVTVSFENTDEKLLMIASADCCSLSWFELIKEPYTTMINKEIIDIDFDSTIILPESEVQDVDQNNLIIVTFSDKTNFKFALRNSSNGYYSGSLGLVIA